MSVNLSRYNVLVDTDDIRILKDNNLHEEILYWHREEWEANPDLVLTIAETIRLAYEEPGKLEKKISLWRQS